MRAQSYYHIVRSVMASSSTKSQPITRRVHKLERSDVVAFESVQNAKHGGRPLEIRVLKHLKQQVGVHLLGGSLSLSCSCSRAPRSSWSPWRGWGRSRARSALFPPLPGSLRAVELPRAVFAALGRETWTLSSELLTGISCLRSMLVFTPVSS